MLRKLAFFMLFCFLFTHSAWAATRTWDVAEGDWNDPANWSPAIVPVAADLVNVGNGGTINVSGIQPTVATLNVGTSTGTGTVNILGAGTLLTVPGDSPLIGEFNDGTMNILAGAVVRANTTGSGNFCIGRSNAIGIVNVSGAGSQLSSDNFLHLGHFLGHGYLNITDGGACISSGTLFIRDGYGTINITDGTLTTTHFYNDGVSGIFNIFGSGSDITSSTAYNRGTQLLDTNFYIDSSAAGTSSVNTTSATANVINLAGGHRVTAWGFAAQDSANTFELFTGRNTGNFYNSFSMADAPDLEIVSPGTNGHFVLGFADDTPVWNLDTHREFYPASDRGYAGWVHIEGEQLWEITAKFIFEDAASTGLAHAFIAYLNNGLAASGSHFTVKSINDQYVELALPDNFLTVTGLDTLGWGLEHFNETYNTNVTLFSLTHVPEPATWLMLLMGGGMLLVWRKKRSSPPKA